MIRCIVVDDDPLSRLVLERYIAHDHALELIRSGSNAADAAAALRRGEADLVFLDLELPEPVGLELLAAAADPPLVILVTGRRGIEGEASAAGAVDCVVKPITFARFQEAIRKVRERADDAPTRGPDLAPFAARFLADRRADLGRFEDLFASGELEQIARIAHRIKGTGAIFGFPLVGTVGGRLERVAHAGDVGETARALEELRHALAERRS